MTVGGLILGAGGHFMIFGEHAKTHLVRIYILMYTFNFYYCYNRYSNCKFCHLMLGLFTLSNFDCEVECEWDRTKYWVPLNSVVVTSN